MPYCHFSIKLSSVPLHSRTILKPHHSLFNDIYPNPMAQFQKKAEPFPQFDVVSDSSDHYHANSKFDVSAAVSKKIMQEWKILEKHLPDSIFVRAYDGRIDLLRAVIIGANGTPYHDGLYFLDIAFPSDYPARPPFLYYRSFGLRINPNLYANGKVCLSLVNTWPGKKTTERWSPNESTMLQVLLSIQALVLNEKPYFNEPGHVMCPGRAIWEKKSNAYNEDVFVLCCKTMLYLLRKPPKNFEGFVVSHFKDRGHMILSACNAYVNEGARIGHYHTNGVLSAVNLVDVSVKFKGLMAQLYPDLVSSFNRCGAPVGNFVEQLNVQRRTTSLVAKRKKIGIAGMVWGKLKLVLGLKNKKKNDRGPKGIAAKKKTTPSS